MPKKQGSIDIQIMNKMEGGSLGAAFVLAAFFFTALRLGAAFVLALRLVGITTQ
jgi:hypothetical protein